MQVSTELGVVKYFFSLMLKTAQGLFDWVWEAACFVTGGYCRSHKSLRMVKELLL
jgi:hypothetical protein